MAGIKAEKDIFDNVADELLDSRISDYHLGEIASSIVDWEMLSPYIGLTESEQKEISEDFQDRYNLQKRQALLIWRWKSGDNATYRTLIRICCRQGLVSLAEIISNYLHSNQLPRSSLLLNETFYQYLLDCYSTLPHPSRLQWPSKCVHIDIAPAYFDLVLYDAPLNIPTGMILPLNSFFKEITLNSVLTKKEGTKRLLAFFEGIAGSGKTMLSWHACREWAKKQILEHFQLVILVELSSPQVKKATKLEDIIPYPDEKARHTLASAIIDQKGESICLFLDGLDEAPNSLLDFLIGLIQGRVGDPQVPNLSFVMTSRPDPRVTERLESVLSSRIIIKGFNKEQLYQFLDQSLGINTKMRVNLQEKFEINPKLEGLCSLPINAVIMSFLSHIIEGDAPLTQTSLYEPLVCNFLIRHMSLRHNIEERPLIKNLLSDIPSEIKDAFQKICSLAYWSSLKTKQLFTKNELEKNYVDINNTLGLLQIHPKITMYGSERYYRFFHSSLQEFLAAVHLSAFDQPLLVKEVLSNIPLSQVLPFYAGLTHLQNRQSREILSKVLAQALDSETVAQQLSRFGDPRQKSLAFINCLYECQNKPYLESSETSSVVNSSVENAVLDLQREAVGFPNASNLLMRPMFHSLRLQYLPLTPLDCLSLGYYVCIKSCMPAPYEKILAFNLSGCSIDHFGLRVLFTEMKKNIQERTLVRVQLQLANNTFSQESLPYLKCLIEGQSNLEGIGLCHCFKQTNTDLCYVLKCLVEGLSNNSSCSFVDLSANEFEPTHVFHFLLLLRVCLQLRYLVLQLFDLSRVMHLFSSAIRLSFLECLDVSYCSITDLQLTILGRAISDHPSLFLLHLYYNQFTPTGLSNFLQYFENNVCSKLTYLGISDHTNEHHKQLLHKINHFRRSLQHAILICNSLLDSQYVYRACGANLCLTLSL